jgi:hypothetical protein
MSKSIPEARLWPRDDAWTLEVVWLHERELVDV